MLLRGRQLDLRRPLVVGVLNVTPDSFFDGGALANLSELVARARQMAEEGADLLDLGGESTRPGAAPVTASDELARVLPAVEAVFAAVDLPVSVDTRRAAVAEAALSAGAAMVNDVSGFGDPAMAEVVARHGAAWVLMHMPHAVGAMAPTQAAGMSDDLAVGIGQIHDDLAAAIAALSEVLDRLALEALLPQLPLPLACALGMALAELDGLGSGGWRSAPPSAFLLPAGEAALAALDEALQTAAAAGHPPTVKWKVAAAADAQERRLLDLLLAQLPANGRLRLDANGGWDRATAQAWAQRLVSEPRLEWLEQPLPPDDRAGLEALARRLPEVPQGLTLRRRPLSVTTMMTTERNLCTA